MHIYTLRLKIIPMTDEELKDLIEKYRDVNSDLSAAYNEMFQSSLNNSSNRLWFTAWKMILLSNGAYVGDLGFKGPACNGMVEIGYGVIEEYEGLGLVTEAVDALCKWAFSFKEVTCIEAETDANNKASQRVLQKVGFVLTGERGLEGPRFRLNNNM